MALKNFKSPWSYAVAIGSMFLFAACGDDSSSTKVAEPVDDPSSSSIAVETPDGEESSSSVIQSDNEGSSSNIDSLNSSSSISEESSSSKVPEPAEGATSSSSVEQNCSAILKGKSGWSWDVPKECRFNPDITYGTMTDSRDGQTYKIIKIGNQTWMAENLNYADSTNTPSLLERSWCYNKKPENCAVGGRLYTWAAAIDSVKLATDADNPQDCGYGKTCTLPTTVQGICPDGWHLPTQAEWETLFTEVGGQSMASDILKSLTGWYSNGSGTNDVGFSAIPAGFRYNNGRFIDSQYAYFWCASEYDSLQAHDMDLDYFYKSPKLFSFEKNYAFSVRCLKDDP